MSQQEKKIALAMDAQNLLDTEMHEIKGGYDCETGFRQSCSTSCSNSRSK